MAAYRADECCQVRHSWFSDRGSNSGDLANTISGPLTGMLLHAEALQTRRGGLEPQSKRL